MSASDLLGATSDNGSKLSNSEVVQNSPRLPDWAIAARCAREFALPGLPALKAGAETLSNWFA
jgi:hypothetical protein